MTKKISLFLFSLFLISLFAQSAFDDCERVYTKVQHLPSLKISNEAFEDTLSAVLKANEFPSQNNTVIYKFAVTTKLKIDDRFGNS